MAKLIGEVVGLVLVIAFIVWKIRPPLKRLMAQQEEGIRTSIAAADAAEAAATHQLERARRSLEAARDDAAAIVELARRTAEQIHAEAERRGAAVYERLVESAASEADLERQRVRHEIMNEVGTVVMAATERVVAAEADGERQRALVSEAIGAAEAMS